MRGRRESCRERYSRVIDVDVDGVPVSLAVGRGGAEAAAQRARRRRVWRSGREAKERIGWMHGRPRTRACNSGDGASGPS